MKGLPNLLRVIGLVFIVFLLTICSTTNMQKDEVPITDIEGTLILDIMWDPHEMTEGQYVRWIVIANFTDHCWYGTHDMIPRRMNYELRGSVLSITLCPNGDPIEYVEIVGRFEDVKEDKTLILPFFGTAMFTTPLYAMPMRGDVRGELFGPSPLELKKERTFLNVSITN